MGVKLWSTLKGAMAVGLLALGLCNSFLAPRTTLWQRPLSAWGGPAGTSNARPQSPALQPGPTQAHPSAPASSWFQLNAESLSATTDFLDIEEPAVEPEIIVSKKGLGKVFVAGGSGFVGREVCKQLINDGARVTALSRSGKPEVDGEGDQWVHQVEWVEGNALDRETYAGVLAGSDCVISCIGGFGKTDAYMGLVNGDCNMEVVEAAKDAGVKRAVFVSVHDYKVPRFVAGLGYFTGKRRTERLIGELFGDHGYVLRPGPIYGERLATIRLPRIEEPKKVKIPLTRVGKVVERVTMFGPVKSLAKSGLPLADVAYTQPLSVEAVANAAICCAADEEGIVGVRGADGTPITLDIDIISDLSSSTTPL
ncbi:unnamed protein product [Chrysoparadoxa australica]